MAAARRTAWAPLLERGPRLRANRPCAGRALQARRSSHITTTGIRRNSRDFLWRRVGEEVVEEGQGRRRAQGAPRGRRRVARGGGRGRGPGRGRAGGGRGRRAGGG